MAIDEACGSESGRETRPDVDCLELGSERWAILNRERMALIRKKIRLREAGRQLNPVEKFRLSILTRRARAAIEAELSKVPREKATAGLG